MYILALHTKDIECLKYLFNNNFPSNRKNEYCIIASELGNLEIINILHENNCPWDEITTKTAACNDNLEVLKYLHENGCPWNKSIYEMVIEEDCVECLKYLIENECPKPNNLCYDIVKHINMICKILCYLPELYVNINNKYLECLKYLHNTGYYWNKEELLNLIKNDKMQKIYEYIENT